MCLKPKLTYEEPFDRLRELTEEKLHGAALSAKQKQRLEEELSVVKQTNTAGVFLQYHNTMYALKEYGAICSGIMHCSFLCYILGLTKVDPLDYKLPFERYYNTERNALPYFPLVASQEHKEKVLAILRENFDGEFLQSCAFSLDVAKIGGYRLFAEDEIYQKTLKRFGMRNFEEDEGYFGIKAAESIFAETDGKFVYQEQFYTICNRLLDVDNTTADLWRKSMCRRRKSECEPIRERFENALGKAGAGIFDYLYDRMMFAVSKAYVIGLLFLDF